ncbi:MAG: ABC transporter ATP-binding protein [Gammaproteobacteria bacterium]|nr:ABC transporter ATP-binding protein [Gammaproteobacteria bacterium]
MSGLLELRGVTVKYTLTGGSRRRELTAVDDVSFTLQSGEMLGLVGESGCGKSTLGRAILRLVPLSAGEVHWQGRRIDRLRRKEFRGLRRELQLVFQDPNACLDPRMTIVESVAEPLRSSEPGLPRAQRIARATALLDEVGLDSELSDRYPHQASGGQLQRAGIARALILDPRLVVCDEPVSALDVSVQGQIVNLLARIRRERGLASLFISHNLAVVAGLCERVMVMYLGRIVEIAPRAALLPAPLHPYSRMLLDSVPRISPAARRRPVAVPVATDPDAPVAGCAFAARCPHVIAHCRSELPPLQARPDGRLVACHRAAEWPGGLPPATA